MKNASVSETAEWGSVPVRYDVAHWIEEHGFGRIFDSKVRSYQNWLSR